LNRILEEEVIIKCRTQDVALLEGLLELIKSQYNEQLAKANFQKPPLKSIAISKDSYLPSNSAGGVLVSSKNGRIECDNTLETRLEYAFERMLPSLRVKLFGQTENRKFFD
jgi:V-type H+-transporting ATPase subunit E